MDITRGGGYLNRIQKSITFTGAANLGQAATNTTIFTVTGEILVVALVPFCTVNLGESGATATISLGVANAPAATLFIAATNSVDIDADDFWVDTAPDPFGIALPAALKDIIITDNIVAACAVTNTNAGTIRFDMYWMPLSANAAVT